MMATAAAAAAASATTTAREAVPPLEFPESAEEAAALLGATITRCGVAASHKEAVLPPAGMHPAFAVTTNSAELFHRLYVLRAVLRTVAANAAAGTTTTPKGPVLPAAPSILQVLKKLLGISTQLAATAAAASSAAATSSEVVVKVSKSEQQQRLLLLKHKHETPPMLSTPCRRLWVDCVVLCHALHSSGNSSSDSLTLQFVRQMLGLASIHPRSAKAAGGVRIAALAVVAALLEHNNDAAAAAAVAAAPSKNIFVLASHLAPWSLDVLQVCLKALRSAGNGEPTFRESAIRAACATAIACRNAAWKNRREALTTKSALLLLQGAMEDKAIAESIKVLKQAATDKFPEVRGMAATFAALLAPVLVPLTSSSSSSSHHAATSTADPLASLEDVLQFSLKNLDDEFPVVADGWAEAASRCMSTAIQYNEQTKQAAAATERAAPGGAESSTSSSAAAATSGRFGSRYKPNGLVHTCTRH
jgi:hypothetical protein